MPRRLIGVYIGIAIVTLIFQIRVRLLVCGSDCGLSLAKGVIWALMWPVSWIVYLAGGK